MKYKLLAASILATMSTTALSATYKLTELGSFDEAKHTYVTDVSESGHVIGLANGLYNLPIDISYIDFTDSIITDFYDAAEANFELIDKEITFTLDDIENNNAVATNPDAHAFMHSFLRSERVVNNSQYQNVGNLAALRYPGNQQPAQEQLFFDIASVDYDGVTRSVNAFYNGIAEDGTSVGWGSAPFDKLKFTPDDETEEETHFVRDFINRAAIISDSGVVFEIPPEFDEFGGISAANDIVKTDDGYVVVGQTSVGIPSDRQEDIDDDCDGLNIPVSACIENLYRSSSTRLFDLRAVKWTLDTSFNITSTEKLGVGVTPEDDENFALVSNALAINSNGIAAGTSDIRDNSRSSTIRSLPVYYKDGKVEEIVDQDDDWFDGKSTAINNNNIVTGYALRPIEGANRYKFFYHDIATGSTVFPTDFFGSSSSYANDINDNGIIVGEGETDVFNVGSRRREAFMYQVGDDKITNINDLLPCYESDGETRYKYLMSEAKAINNDNEIFGVATKTVEKTDSLGGVVTDTNGDIEYESVVVAVKLTPIEGEIDKCSDEETETYERQSASFPWYSLLLLPLVGLRRLLK